MQIKKLLDFLKDENRYQQYVDNAPYGIILISIQGKYVDFNRAACRITGYDPKELMFMSIDQISPGDILKATLAAFSTLMKIGKLNIELPFLKKSGKRAFWRMNATRLSDQMYLTFVKETTMQHELQCNLEKKVTELQKLNDLMINRELRMIQLKEEIKTLKSRI